MSHAATSGGVSFLADFLAYLREQGFYVGVDHYVRAERLVEQAGGRDPEDLKTLLCPLFATSQKQQEQFNTVFDDYIRHLPSRLARQGPPGPEDEDKDKKEKKKKGKKKKRSSGERLFTALVILLSVAVALAVAWRLWPSNGQSGVNENLSVNAVTTQANESNDNSDGPSNSNEGVDDGRGMVGTTDTSPAITPDATPEVSKTSEASDSQPSEKPTEPPPLILYALVAALFFAAFLLWELYRLARRKLVLRKRPARKPPTFWPLRVEAPARRIYDSEDFYRAARLLRRRQVAEYERLDIGGTIAATVEALGYPVFRFKPDSRAPEYLVLIDRASFRDHQSQLFNELALALEREGLFLVRYFYEGDPRVCCDERGERCLQLTDLQNRYVGHRLLIFGDGERMIDPITGSLADWANMFSGWQERALLTPETRWGLREITLSEQFAILPATLEGLVALSDRFELLLKGNLPAWPENGSAVSPSDGGGALDTAALRTYLGEETYRLLCACAVYPELQWNLTLHLGTLPFISEEAMRERNLLRMVRLPWFRTGAMPEEMRWPLINDLSPAERDAVRAALIKFLERDPPPAGTFAADKHEMELAVQRLLQQKDAESLERLREVARHRHPGQILKDRTLVQYLERAPNPFLDLLLPRRLRKYFFPDGLPLFGLKTGARFAVTALAASIACIAIWAGVFPFQEPTQKWIAERLDIKPTQTPLALSSPTPEVAENKPESLPTPTPEIKQGNYCCGVDGVAYCALIEPVTVGEVCFCVDATRNQSAGIVCEVAPVAPLLPAPQLRAPRNGATIRSYVVQLSWAPVDGASSYNVEVIAVDPYSIRRLEGRRGVYQRGITDTSYALNLGPRLNKYGPMPAPSRLSPAPSVISAAFSEASPALFNGDPERYRWRVSAVDALGREGSKSRFWEFDSP